MRTDIISYTDCLDAAGDDFVNATDTVRGELVSS